MAEYFHSVRLDADRCKGCVNCIKRCPTEAIRIRTGKAKITQSRCIDCGECIRRCSNHAKSALTDDLDSLAGYAYNVALPAPSLYVQFSSEISVRTILGGLIGLGFDDVFEVARGAELVTPLIRAYMDKADIKKPVISSACTAVVRLIQVKFPELIHHIIPVHAPVEAAAQLARWAAEQRTGFRADQIGVWFITPCPAKMTVVHQPLGLSRSHVTGAIAISKIYGDMLKIIAHHPAEYAGNLASRFGVGWAVAGGETVASGLGNTLIVQEIHQVHDALEQVALGKLANIDYLECLACAGGCIGGPLTVENRFVAEHRMKRRIEKMTMDEAELAELPPGNAPENLELAHTQPILARPLLKLDDDIVKAMHKVELIEKTLDKLPGLDCGSCGSPNCKALAEDIVQGMASETDCIFKLRERVSDLAREMVDLAEKTPPPLEKGIAGNVDPGGNKNNFPGGNV